MMLTACNAPCVLGLRDYVADSERTPNSLLVSILCTIFSGQINNANESGIWHGHVISQRPHGPPPTSYIYLLWIMFHSRCCKHINMHGLPHTQHKTTQLTTKFFSSKYDPFQVCLACNSHKFHIKHTTESDWGLKSNVLGCTRTVGWVDWL